MENKFFKPKSLQEALEILEKEDVQIIAGGTDLVVELREGLKTDKAFLDISSLDELKGITEDGEEIVIKACSTHSEVEKSEVVKENLSILYKGCSMVGSTLIRNRGTIGGNIANNGNCADSVPPLFILDGKVVLKSLKEERTLTLNQFFKSRGKLDMNKDELLYSIKVKPLKGYKWELVKVGRRKSLAISRLTLAIALKEENGVIEDLRIIPGAMLPNYRRLEETENKFKKALFNRETIKEIADSAAEEAIKMAGRRWSTEYKEPVLKGLILRTLESFLDNK